MPKAIRLEIVRRKENDDNKRGSREAYFDLIDYRTIAINNWALFESFIGFGDRPNASKEKRTRWMADVNEIRNQVAHASSGVILDSESITTLEKHLHALNTHLANVDPLSDEEMELENVDDE